MKNTLKIFQLIGAELYDSVHIHRYIRQELK